MLLKEWGSDSVSLIHLQIALDRYTQLPVLTHLRQPKKTGLCLIRLHLRQWEVLDQGLALGFVNQIYGNATTLICLGIICGYFCIIAELNTCSTDHTACKS